MSGLTTPTSLSFAQKPVKVITPKAQNYGYTVKVKENRQTPKEKPLDILRMGSDLSNKDLLGIPAKQGHSETLDTNGPDDSRAQLTYSAMHPKATVKTKSIYYMVNNQSTNNLSLAQTAGSTNRISVQVLDNEAF